MSESEKFLITCCSHCGREIYREPAEGESHISHGNCIVCTAIIEARYKMKKTGSGQLNWLVIISEAKKMLADLSAKHQAEYKKLLEDDEMRILRGEKPYYFEPIKAPNQEVEKPEPLRDPGSGLPLK